MFQGIQWITFDAGGTLIFPYPSVGEVYGSILAEEGVQAPADALNKRFSAGFKEMTARERARTDEAAERAFWLQLVTHSIEPWCPAEKIDTVFQKAWDAFGTARCWRFAPEAPAVLGQLKAQGYRLAVLSNSDRRFLRVFDELQLTPYFEHIFLSGEMGAEKPDRQLFDAVAKRLEAEGSQILHVGDSLRHDGEGARHAGWHAAILGHELESLSDLPALLQK